MAQGVIHVTPVARPLLDTEASPSTGESHMRARAICVMAMLFVSIGARPVLADGPIVFQRDGTFFYSVHAELLAQPHGSAESSDSTEAPKLFAIAGGASLAGLAAYFIATNGGNSGVPGLPGLPRNEPGGVLIPPQEQFTPALPNQPYNPGGGTGGTTGTFTGPVTTAPEPVTMTLLATGLAGLGGAQLRRRRRG
jgi:hypothetical protein